MRILLSLLVAAFHALMAAIVGLWLLAHGAELGASPEMAARLLASVQIV